MSRRKKRGVAAVPKRLRWLTEVAGRWLVACWDRDGFLPFMAVVIEGPHGEVAVRVDRIDDGLAVLEGIAPTVAGMARNAERLRRLASADGIAVVIPRRGLPCAAAVGRRGRYLSEERLEALSAIACDGTIAIGLGGVA